MQPAQLSLTKKDLRSIQDFKGRLFLVTGLVVLLVTASLVAWSGFEFWKQVNAWPLLFFCSLAYLASIMIMRQFLRFPRTKIIGLIFLSVSLAFVGVVVLLALCRFYYSRSFLLTAFGVTLLWLLICFELFIKSQPLRLVLVPGGKTGELLHLKNINWQMLERPEITGAVDGVVVDMHGSLSMEWIRFLSNCGLRRIPVYHSAVVLEAATGRVSLSHLSEALIDEYSMHPFYSTFKRIIDVGIVVFFCPVILPFAGLLALLIRLDSHGPIFFWQERVGKQGVSFRMCKFRSMCTDAEGRGARFAQSDDSRITRIGKIIRPFRFDEIPQLWNVLKGDMSLVGPRPEQVHFAKQFESQIPFYAYRHLVKPGLTGWAQVMYGYASGVDQNRDKLEHDLYYTKYFSLWLDFWIVSKTIRTVLTRYGAC
ncbi:MAG: sugar transferase [Pedobacter sp.]